MLPSQSILIRKNDFTHYQTVVPVCSLGGSVFTFQTRWMLGTPVLKHSYLQNGLISAEFLSIYWTDSLRCLCISNTKFYHVRHRHSKGDRRLPKYSVVVVWAININCWYSNMAINRRRLRFRSRVHTWCFLVIPWPIEDMPHFILSRDRSKIYTVYFALSRDKFNFFTR